MAIKTTATQASKKDTQAPAKKAPAKSAKATAKPAAKPATKTVKAKEEAPKAAPASKAKAPRVDTSKPIVAQKPTANQSGKTAYHVSKRDNDGREWKVFIQGSNKVIKLFNTQAEALDYAKSLCKNKDDGSYVLLHGLDGKIRKF